MTAVDPAAVIAADCWPPVLAVDPGDAHTGIVVRCGAGALEGVTVDRAADEEREDHTGTPRYAARVLATIRQLEERTRGAVAAEAGRRGVPVPPVRVACETLVPPTARHRAKGGVGVSTRVLSALPATAAVMGAVLGAYPGALLVAPNGGSRGWDELGSESYPGVLRGRTPPGWLAGGSERRHQRSAWAIGGAAHLLYPATAAPGAVPAPAPAVPRPVAAPVAAPTTAAAPTPVPAAERPATAAGAPTPERQQQLRANISQRVAESAPGGTGGAPALLAGDPLGLLLALHRAIRASDATEPEQDWLRSRLPALARATVAELMRGRPRSEVLAAADHVRDAVRQLVERSAA